MRETCGFQRLCVQKNRAGTASLIPHIKVSHGSQSYNSLLELCCISDHTQPSNILKSTFSLFVCFFYNNAINMLNFE